MIGFGLALCGDWWWQSDWIGVWIDKMLLFNMTFDRVAVVMKHLSMMWLSMKLLSLMWLSKMTLLMMQIFMCFDDAAFGKAVFVGVALDEAAFVGVAFNESAFIDASFDDYAVNAIFW